MQSDYKHLKLDVKKSLKMKIHLSPGGGWVARITPKTKLRLKMKHILDSS